MSNSQAESVGVGEVGISADGLALKSYYPYRGVLFDEVVTFGEKKFRVIIYQAYDAFGLVGSECNGVAVFNEVKRDVVCDEIQKEPTGWFGASVRQVKAAKNLVAMSWEEFRDFINAHPRTRYRI